MLRIVKPKTKRGARALEKRAPKTEENVKKLMLLHGTKVSSTVKAVISDLYHLKRSDGNAIKFSRENGNVRPFEGGGEAPLEHMSHKSDCSLFVFGSHSKKRPDNLVLGRMFDHHLYDMIEVGVEDFKSIDSLGGGRKAAPQEGSKPCFAFIGQAFESQPEFRQLKEMLIDFFRGEVVEVINLSGLDRVFVCVATANKVLFRHCAIIQKSSDSEVPLMELIEVGPSFNMTLRRNRLPSDDLKKVAMKAASKSAKKKVKNVSADPLAGKVGRIYMPKQEVDGMALAKMKGLKRERRQAAAVKNLSVASEDGTTEGATSKKSRTQ